VQHGRGQDLEGDDIVGLSRAFMYGGAPVVMVALWSVDDTSTAELMKLFYQGLTESMAVAEALRAAQLKLMEEYPSPSTGHLSLSSVSRENRETGKIYPSTLTFPCLRPLFSQENREYEERRRSGCQIVVNCPYCGASNIVYDSIYRDYYYCWYCDGMFWV